MKKLTVFTPTYNRAYCLHLLYESLCRQRSDDFMWLIIDDGSSDGTADLVGQWQLSSKFPIEYVYKENGGMHTGHNSAYARIQTELNVCIDSDDYLPDNAIDRMLELWAEHGSDDYAGMVGLDATPEGRIVGNQFPDDLKSSTYTDLSRLYNATGDKKLVYRTEVTKKYDPYPTFGDEKFVPLYMPVLIDKDFPLLCFNEVFCIVDYQTDGSTLNIFNQYFRNPRGFWHYRKIQMDYLPGLNLKFRSAVHYVSSSIILREKHFFQESPKKLLTFLAIPFGIALYIYLSRNRNKKRDIKKYIAK